MPVALAQRAHRAPAHRDRGRERDIEVRDAGEVCAGRIDLQRYAEGLGAPVVADALGARELAQDLLHLLGLLAQRDRVLAEDTDRDRHADRLARLELTDVDSCARDPAR